MPTNKRRIIRASAVRTNVRGPARTDAPIVQRAVKIKRPRVKCEDCKAQTAFHAWRDAFLTDTFNFGITFSPWGIPPQGTRAVIELVTAQIVLPHGDSPRLRMYTSLGTVPSNIDLVLTAQGSFANWLDPTQLFDTFVGTHAIRAYTDSLIDFNIHRSTSTGGGHALICISGYLATP